MIVCITEKPSVARDIAAILGANDRHDGYYEGNNYQVTWTFGHLCTLKEPADYSPLWKNWSLAQLPMLPERFGIKLIDDKGIEKQFNVIKQLIENASEVVNCGDAGQEGELIQRWVMQKAEIKCPVKRLWISSLTNEAIKEGFQTLKPAAEYDNLYYAGLSRAIGDWILGMNATRLYSLKYASKNYSSKSNVLSIGRVQTPTLALIVQRHQEIENFTPKDYWELKTTYREAVFSATAGKYETEQQASEALAKITGQPLTITDVSEKKGKEAPPRLFDLTSLQVECNKKWGWTADDTLKLIQSLYEKKVTTYPRVDTTYLPDDIYPKIPQILRQMSPYTQWTTGILNNGKIPKTKKVFDNSKVTDHHAIIPTGQNPAQLIGLERQLYHLIALRFIAAFYPDCEFMQTTAMADVAGEKFKAVDKVITKNGWRDLYSSDSNSKDNDTDNSDSRILPPLKTGESGPHTPDLAKKQTQPPKPYTEGTLLRAMESAGKTVDDEELREAMKENGIGRPSTRAAIIETLFRRKYISRKGKSIAASQAGIALIDIIEEELLKSAKLTGLWENKLRRIERGSYSANDFINDLKALINDIVIRVLNDNSLRRIEVDQSGKSQNTDKAEKVKSPRQAKPRIKSLTEIKCPICNQGYILKGKSAYGCSRFREGCPLRLDFSEYQPDLSPQRLSTAISKKFKKK